MSLATLNNVFCCQALVLFPVLQSVALLIFLVPWFIYMVYLASSGEARRSNDNEMVIGAQYPPQGQCLLDAHL